MKKTLIITALALLLLGSFGVAVYNKGVQQERAVWQGVVQEHQAEVDALIGDKVIREKAHIREVSKIEERIAKSEEEYKKSIMSVDAYYSSELLKHEARASRYENLSKDRANELSALTSRYDRVIVDGTRVVKRCSDGLRARESLIEQLISKIKSDEKLINAP